MKSDLRLKVNGGGYASVTTSVYEGLLHISGRSVTE